MGGAIAPIGGTVGGAALGAGLAPFTGGLSLPAMMALGGALGSGTASAATGQDVEQSLLNAGLGGLGGYGVGMFAPALLGSAVAPAAGAVGSPGSSVIGQALGSGAAPAAIGSAGAGSGTIGSALGQLPGAGGTASAGVGSATSAAAPTTGGLGGMSALEKAFLATQTGSILGQVLNPPPRFQPPSIPSPPVGGGGGYRPVSAQSMEQLAQLIAQRRNRDVGKFTV